MLDEAFQLGIPAIVSDRGAPAERIGEAGDVFRADDAADLRRILVRAIEDRALVDRWRAAIQPLRSFASHAAAVADVYREVTGMHSPLLTTPRELRSRRDRFRSRQVETRTRKIDHLEGDVRQFRADQERAAATMAEMDRAHRDKDKHIAWLDGEKRRREIEAAELAEATRALEARGAEALLRKDTELSAYQAELAGAAASAKQASEARRADAARAEAEFAALASKAALAATQARSDQVGFAARSAERAESLGAALLRMKEEATASRRREAELTEALALLQGRVEALRTTLSAREAAIAERGSSLAVLSAETATRAAGWSPTS